MKRRFFGSTLFAAVVALGAVALTTAVRDAGLSSTPFPPGQGVALDAATTELVAAKPTPAPAPKPTPAPSPSPSPTATPCNSGGGGGAGTGNCKSLLTDSKSPGPILTAARMKPGDNARGSVVITANGNVFVSLFESAVSHSGPAGSGNLAHRLILVVTDQTLRTQLYNGALDSMPATISICGLGTPPHQPCQRWANGEAHTFSFVIMFANAADHSDNAYQATGATATFTWGATR